MERRTLLAMGVTGLLAAPRAAEGQQPSRIPMVGVLDPGSVHPGSPMLTAFRQGLRDLGGIDGQNIRLDPRYADWKPERLPRIAAELVRLRADHVIE